jgi:hypothetical protein
VTGSTAAIAAAAVGPLPAIALQAALLIPLGAVFIGLGSSFRIMPIPDPVPTGRGEPMALG